MRAIDTHFQLLFLSSFKTPVIFHIKRRWSWYKVSTSLGILESAMKGYNILALITLASSIAEAKSKYCTCAIISLGLYMYFFTSFSTEVYISERLVLQTIYVLIKEIWAKNQRFIIESKIKSRAGYNGMHTVYVKLIKRKGKRTSSNNLFLRIRAVGLLLFFLYNSMMVKHTVGSTM